MTTPLRLLSDAIHLAAPSRALPVPAFDHGYERYLEAFCAPGDPGRLVAIFETTEDWPVWECHPEGDEVVVVLSGRARFHQELDGRVHTVEVGPHEAVINPAGVVHTADVIQPFIALYITPGPGTHHRPR